MSIGKSPEILSQQILVGIILVGRLDVKQVSHVSSVAIDVPKTNKMSHAFTFRYLCLFLCQVIDPSKIR